MRIAVTGSIATDHLMVFPGRFADQLLPGQLAHLSLSFLVDRLEIRHGGVAANVAYGLGGFGLSPLLVGAVGADFAEYEVWLKEHGVDTAGVRVCPELQTARFLCVSDQDANQIAAFYAGAMARARDIDLAPLLTGPEPPGLVLVSPDDPPAMLRHTAACRAAGTAFAADPSQQLARLDGEQARALTRGATWLFTNEYEAALLEERTGRSHEEVLASTGTWITTLGARGVRLERHGQRPLVVPAVTAAAPADPTGAGDAFRAGFLAAVSHGAPLQAAARLGNALAATALAAVGSQAYDTDPAALAALVEQTYGAAALAPLAPLLGGRP
ncbi:carbohydrate kinase family protein [Streptomyces asoensis]|uniref:carbohydrate kinase family protein n=1 Tax=Streptomyces asoensis TaxID=249586 RepID=UPI003316DA58